MNDREKEIYKAVYPVSLAHILAMARDAMTVAFAGDDPLQKVIATSLMKDVHTQAAVARSFTMMIIEGLIASEDQATVDADFKAVAGGPQNEATA